VEISAHGTVRTSIAVGDIAELAKALAQHTYSNVFDSWGDPTIILDRKRGSVEVRTSIGAEVPADLDTLALAYSKHHLAAP